MTKASLNKLYGIKVELINKINYRKYPNTWRLNNLLLNDQWVIDKIREGTQNFLESNENGKTT
jgi:hypothetical protein